MKAIFLLFIFVLVDANNLIINHNFGADYLAPAAYQSYSTLLGW